MLTLLRKEVAEHGWIVLAVAAISVFGFLLMLLTAALRDSGSVLDSVRAYAVSFFLLIVITLCNRLVVQEYSGKTQLFLEALPISRGSMLTTKYLLGGLIAGAILFGCFGLAFAISLRSEVIDGRFVSILVSRLAVFVFCVYSFFFMMGLLGRYRIAIYLALIMTVAILVQSTEIEFLRFGPMGLMDDRFAFERQAFPVANLSQSGLIGLGCLVVALGMGLGREGSVASLMAEKMSYREKVFLSVSLLSLVVAGSVLDAKRLPDPYSIADAATRDFGMASVVVENVGEGDDAAELADRLHRDLTGLATYLDYQSAPSLFVVHRGDLDADRFEPAELKNASGVLLRANYSASDWSYDKFAPIALDVWLTHATNEGGTFEPRCWVLEGLSEFWALRRDLVDELQTTNVIDRRAVAAYGLALDHDAGTMKPNEQNGLTPDDMDRWYSLRERLGQPLIRSLACSALVSARQRHGPEKLRAFLSEILTDQQPASFMTDWKRFRRPISVVWKETMGSEYRSFQASWLNDLRQARSQFQKVLEGVPRLNASGQFVSKSSETCKLVIDHQIELGDKLDAVNMPVSVQYQTIGIFDDWEDDAEVRVQVQPAAGRQTIDVQRLFTSGQRVRWTTGVRASELECDVISGWRRQIVRAEAEEDSL